MIRAKFGPISQNSNHFRGIADFGPSPLSLRIFFVRFGVLGILPDTAATCVIVEHPFAVLPQHITRTIRYFVNDALQFDRAADFVEFLGRCYTSVIVDYNVRHCVCEKKWKLIEMLKRRTKKRL